MFTIQLQRIYKYSYIITRNRREIARFNTKKEAKDALFQIFNDYRIMAKDNQFFDFAPALLTGGNSMVVYSSSKRTLTNNKGDEFRDYFHISRINNY
ncbi:MAG: hypothetical protein Q4A21_01030 [bacterium]|nr:hypothetical protein [bacterium]